MTTSQKIIKYLAIAFAIFLIVTIFSAMTMGIYVLSKSFGLVKDLPGEVKDLNCQFNDITNLTIDIDYSTLDIKEGNNFLIQTNNSNISCINENNELEIKEKKKWFNFNNSRNLVVYIPNDYNFDNVYVETGAGEVNIENIITNKLKLDLGAGKAKIDKIYSNKTAINTGAGKLDILSGTIGYLDFNMGVGEVNITSKIIGVNEIDAGIGSLNLNLIGSLDDYKIKIEKGLGSAIVNGNNISRDEIVGIGDNFIDIDGGVGEIKVKIISE